MSNSDAEQYGEPIALLHTLSPQFWFIAVVFFGIGDLATTIVGLELNGVAEVGPLAALLTPYGVLPLVALKLASFLVCGVLWKLTPHPYQIGVPMGLAGLGVVVTLWNAGILALLLA